MVATSNELIEGQWFKPKIGLSINIRMGMKWAWEWANLLNEMKGISILWTNKQPPKQVELQVRAKTEEHLPVAH